MQVVVADVCLSRPPQIHSFHGRSGRGIARLVPWGLRLFLVGRGHHVERVFVRRRPAVEQAILRRGPTVGAVE